MNIVPQLIFRGQAASDPQVAAAVLMGANLTEAASNLGLVQTALQLREESDDQLVALTGTIDRFLSALGQEDPGMAEQYKEAIAGQIQSLDSRRWQKASTAVSLFGDKGKVVAQLTARLRRDWSIIEPGPDTLPFPATLKDAQEWLNKGNRQRDRSNFVAAAGWSSKAGWAFSLHGDFDPAIDAYQRSAQFYQLANKYSSASRVHLKIADVYLSQSLFAEAIAHYDRALALLSEGNASSDKQKRAKDKKAEAIHRALRSNGLEEMFEKRVALFQKVVSLHETAGDTVLEGISRLAVADGFFQLRQYVQAEEQYAQAVALLFNEAKFLMAGELLEKRAVRMTAGDFDRKSVARLYRHAGLAYQRAGEIAKAGKMYEEAGNLLYQSKKYLQAAEEWQWAAEHYQNAGQLRAALNAKKHQAYSLEKGGLPSEAAVLFREIAKEAKQAGEREEEANAIFSLGFILLNNGKNMESVKAFDQACHLRLAQGYDGSAAVYTGLKAIALRGAGKMKEARANWDIALTLIGNDEVKLLMALGNVYELWSLYDAALSMYARGQEIIKSTDDRSMAVIQKNRGRVLIKRGELKSALMFYQRAENLYARLRMFEEVEKMKKAIDEVKSIQ